MPFYSQTLRHDIVTTCRNHHRGPALVQHCSLTCSPERGYPCVPPVSRVTG